MSTRAIINHKSNFRTPQQFSKLFASEVSYPEGIVPLSRRFAKSTKQLATLGPASNTVEMIEKLFLSGADVFRLNFSHGEHAEKAKLVDMIRVVEKKYNHPIAILADLQVIIFISIDCNKRSLIFLA